MRCPRVPWWSAEISLGLLFLKGLSARMACIWAVLVCLLWLCPFDACLLSSAAGCLPGGPSDQVVTSAFGEKLLLRRKCVTVIFLKTRED